MTATGNEAASIAQTAKALGVEAQTSGATGGEAVRLRQLKMLRTGGGGFTGTATVKIDGTNSAGYAYIDDGYHLVEKDTGYAGTFILTVPVPQIMFVQATGKSENMGISGDYNLVKSFGGVNGSCIYVFGDVIVTGS